MDMSRFSPLNWPVVRQLRSGDPFGRDVNTQSQKSKDKHGRTVEADRVVPVSYTHLTLPTNREV